MNLSFLSLATIGLGLSLMLAACTPPPPPVAMDLGGAVLIPHPVKMTATGSSFRLSAKTAIQIVSEDLRASGEMLAGYLRPATGLELPIMVGPEAPNSISLSLDASDEVGEEGYTLSVTEQGVSLKAGTQIGLFYGMQTIRQMLPPELASSTPVEADWLLASGDIVDYPRYGYRGAMLDVSRHFFGVEDVKRYIDFLAMYKMNTLHMHLSDDQGWRIEIKSWPKLTEIGGSTEVGGGEGGFYTQEQFKDLVAYAAERHISIIPEIDMPGHTNAALASYAELNCDGKARDLYTGTEVGFSTFCTDKDVTYQLIDDVVKELAAISPSPYIHIGGDESHSTKKDDYLYFVDRVQDIVTKHGKKMIGWDETAQIELAEGSVVQLWNSEEFGKAAVAQGRQLIMSPAKYAYLDMQYDSNSRIGLHWAAYIEVDAGYNWDPATIVDGIGDASIIGIEAPLWTETVENMTDIEYLVFPRLPGYAEISWTPQAQRNWDTYKERLAQHGAYMEAMEIDYYTSSKVPWAGKETATSGAEQ